MKIILRIGGSVLGSPPNVRLLKRYASVLSEARKAGHSIGVVVGGGPISREYIDSARKLGLSHREQDLIAIQASRLNAKLAGMEFQSPTIPVTIEAMVTKLSKSGIAVMGGLRPGITTDTVAALLGGKWHSDLLIKASDQKGIYTSDPRIDKKARLLRSISYSDLVRILGGEHRPGIHSIVDPVAVRHITKHRLRLVVLDGRNPTGVLKALRGEPVGTLVS